MKSLNHILRWANILLILATLLAYLSPFIDPAKVWLFTFPGLAYPVLLIGNIGFAVFWAMRRQRYFLLSLCCILAGFGYFQSFFGWHFSGSTKPAAHEISVLTYNVGGLKGNNWSISAGMEEKKAVLVKLKEETGPLNIFCVQESYNKPTTEALAKTFGFPYKYQHKGTIIFTTYPILKNDVVPFEETTNSCVWADLKTPGGTVRVYCTHLQSNRLGQTADKIATKGDLREKQTWRDIRFVLKRYKSAVAIRAQQAHAVAKHMAASPHPVILCGDLNDPPVSYVYRLLSSNLQDSFCQMGSGVGSTFAGNLPFLRIDYILPSRQFTVTTHRVPGAPLSDHYPVLARLKW
ncbi:MAG: endonuclease/exonuclease/phosphatase family protein [Bacteroidetes bacterium]|nr:endonuclease/exonuclease/phosphatase family protein [Bacteroidota bacterium]